MSGCGPKPVKKLFHVKQVGVFSGVFHVKHPSFFRAGAGRGA
jgi:hypothetical protein